MAAKRLFKRRLHAEGYAKVAKVRNETGRSFLPYLQTRQAKLVSISQSTSRNIDKTEETSIRKSAGLPK